MIYFILMFTILFCIFVEYYVGSISIRLNSSNKYSFNLNGMIYYLFHPLHNSFLWHTQVICGNYPFMLLLALLLYSTKFDFPMQ